MSTSSRPAPRPPIFVAVCVLAAGACVWQCTGVFVDDFQKAETDRRKMDLGNLANAIHLYQTKYGAYPLVCPAFQPLIDDGELETMPRDPWGNDYVIEPTLGGLRVVTYGADGEPGGEEDDADLSVEVRLPTESSEAVPK